MAPARKTPARKPAQKKQNSSGVSLTFLIVVVVILALVSLVLLLREPISNALNSGSTPAQTTGTGTAAGTQQTTSTTPTDTNQTVGTQTPNTATTNGAGSTQQPGNGQTQTNPGDVKNNTSQTSATSTTPPKKDNLSFSLCFVHVEDNGTMDIERVERTAGFSDSPLNASIMELLKGPNSHESATGLVSLVPPDVKLLSAWIRSGTAYLNFSENFGFNPLGETGLKAQLTQVVLTALQFPTITSVQVLIEGRQVATLGNIAIDKPFTKTRLP